MLALRLFIGTNPCLTTLKGYDSTATVGFALFASVFFVSRLVMFPYIIHRYALSSFALILTRRLRDGISVVPYETSVFANNVIYLASALNDACRMYLEESLWDYVVNMHFVRISGCVHGLLICTFDYILHYSQRHFCVACARFGC